MRAAPIFVADPVSPLSEVAWAAVDAALSSAERASGEVARGSVALLGESDMRALVAGFYRAEALAQGALEQAAGQVPKRYRAELAEQIEDERRHVELFAGWLDALPAVVAPEPTVRQPEHWFVSLLFNELAGYCQFHLLAALADSPDRKAAVLHVVEEERTHVLRLAGWLAGSVAVERSSHRFCRALSGRMRQFFPREDLAPVRAALRDVVTRLVGDVAGIVSGDVAETGEA